MYLIIQHIYQRKDVYDRGGLVTWVKITYIEEEKNYSRDFKEEGKLKKSLGKSQLFLS